MNSGHGFMLRLKEPFESPVRSSGQMCAFRSAPAPGGMTLVCGRPGIHDTGRNSGDSGSHQVRAGHHGSSHQSGWFVVGQARAVMGPRPPGDPEDGVGQGGRPRAWPGSP